MARPDLYAAADDALVWLDENGLDDENYLDGVFSEAEMQFARDNAHRF